MTSFPILRAVSTAYPSVVRTNEFFEKNSAHLIAAWREKSLSKLYTALSDDAANKSLFAKCAARYADDPFHGVKQRYALGEGQSSRMLEVEAINRALGAAGMEASELDLLICVSFRPDEVTPGNAAYVASTIGLDAPILNLEATCSGSLLALQTAAAFVSSGQYQKVGIAVSVTYSRDLDLDESLSWFLGDAAAGFVVTANEDSHQRSEMLSSDVVSTLGTLGAFSHEPCGVHKYKIVKNREAGQVMRESIRIDLVRTLEAALKKANLDMTRPDFLVINTPMAPIADYATKLLGMSREQTVCTFQEVANVGPALLPVNLHRAIQEGRLKPGMIVALHAFGTVSNAGTMIVRWGDTKAAD